ncbi:MAG: hypothetical protein ACLQAT_18265 [Candidatus Binataceae bacterium]
MILVDKRISIPCVQVELARKENRTPEFLAQPLPCEMPAVVA